MEIGDFTFYHTEAPTRRTLITDTKHQVIKRSPGGSAGPALEGPQGQPWRVCRASPGGSAGPVLEGPQGQSWRVPRASPGGSAGLVLEGLQGWSWRVCRFVCVLSMMATKWMFTCLSILNLTQVDLLAHCPHTHTQHNIFSFYF